MFQEALILLILESIQLINVLVLKSVLVSPVLRRDQGFLDQWLGVLWLLGDDSMLTKDIIPRYTFHLDGARK